MAIGIVGAGGPVGQLLLGPLTQQAIDISGWIVALWLTAALSLLALPLSMAFRRPVINGRAQHQPSSQAGAAHDPAAHDSAAHDSAAGTPAAGSGHVALSQALRTPEFWLISGGFAICGFHMSFLTMHMPGVIERCGLPASLAGTWLAVLGLTNVAGSVAVGLMLGRHCPASLLAVLHALRALFIACLLVLPATPLVMFGFAVAMGATYTAALPPTTTLVTRTFGAGGVATLFGMVMLIHQVGSFAGVWLGGLMAEATDGYRAIWLLEIALALIASALYLPLRPARSAEFGGFKQALQG
jgi:predicted MFS family arabinose efflux permease